MRASPSAVKRLPLFAAFVMLGLSRLSGATLVQLSLADMIGQSTTIEHAKVVGAWAAFSGPVIYTHYKLQVVRKGKSLEMSIAGQQIGVLIPALANELYYGVEGCEGVCRVYDFAATR